MWGLRWGGSKGGIVGRSGGGGRELGILTGRVDYWGLMWGHSVDIPVLNSDFFMFRFPLPSPPLPL